MEAFILMLWEKNCLVFYPCHDFNLSVGINPKETLFKMLYKQDLTPGKRTRDFLKNQTLLILLFSSQAFSVPSPWNSLLLKIHCALVSFQRMLRAQAS